MNTKTMILIMVVAASGAGLYKGIVQAFPNAGLDPGAAMGVGIIAGFLALLIHLLFRLRRRRARTQASKD